jgi:hypothetical protein
MADGDLALPVGHVPLTTPSTPALRVVVGRPFRQPLSLPDANTYSSGLELWLSSDPAHRRLFAMFDGYLSFLSPEPGKALGLRLSLSLATLQRYGDMRGALEPPPTAIIYDNVNRDSVEDALHQLIITSYKSKISPSHPILSSRWKGTRLKFRLDGAGANVDAEIGDFIHDFLNGLGAAVAVNAGDQICDADLPLSTDETPQGLPFAGSARRVTLLVDDYAGNKLNPSYYIWRYLKDGCQTPIAQRRVTIITRAPSLPNGQFDHPFLAAIALDLNVPVLPRVLTQVQLPNIPVPTNALLFPVGRLADWHGERWGAALSTIQWRINNSVSLQFETQNTPAAPQAQQDCPIDVTNPSGLYHNRMQAVWRDWGIHLNRICNELQIPAEIVAATIGQESANNPRALALEALRPAELSRLQAANPAVAQNYVSLAPRYGLSVPNPWNGGTTIDSTKSPLTWDDLLDAIDIVPTRMSPGLIQTLVINGEALFAWLAEWYPSISTTFNVVDPLAGGPIRYRDWFFWLLTGEHALLVGAAYHKRSYCRELGGLDLPRMGSLFNSLNLEVETAVPEAVFPVVNDAPFLKDPERHVPPCPPLAPNQAMPRNPWRLRYNDLTYPRNIGRFYNAIQTYFGNGANAAAGGPIPVVRFWQSL